MQIGAYRVGEKILGANMLDRASTLHPIKHIPNYVGFNPTKELA